MKALSKILELSVNNKCKRVSELACGKGIQITPMGVRLIVKKYELLGWRKVRSSYCQIVSFNNRVKRFIFGCQKRQRLS